MTNDKWGKGYAMRHVLDTNIQLYTVTQTQTSQPDPDFTYQMLTARHSECGSAKERVALIVQPACL